MKDDDQNQTKDGKNNLGPSTVKYKPHKWMTEANRRRSVTALILKILTPKNTVPRPACNIFYQNSCLGPLAWNTNCNFLR